MTDTSFLADNKSSSPQDNGKLLENIKITPVDAHRIFSPTVSNTNSVGEDTSSDVITITIPQLYNLVKTYDKCILLTKKKCTVFVIQK